MSIRTTIPIRFGDIDRAGIVYYPNYFDYYHIAFEEFFGAAHGTTYADWIALRKIGFPTVHVEADFAAPLEYGDVVDVEVSVAVIGRSSVEFRFETLARKGHARKSAGAATAPVASRQVASAQVTKVCIDLGTRRPIPIPEDLRPVLTAHERGR